MGWQGRARAAALGMLHSHVAAMPCIVLQGSGSPSRAQASMHARRWWQGRSQQTLRRPEAPVPLPPASRPGALPAHLAQSLMQAGHLRLGVCGRRMRCKQLLLRGGGRVGPLQPAARRAGAAALPAEVARHAGVATAKTPRRTLPAARRCAHHPRAGAGRGQGPGGAAAVGLGRGRGQGGRRGGGAGLHRRSNEVIVQLLLWAGLGLVQPAGPGGCGGRPGQRGAMGRWGAAAAGRAQSAPVPGAC